MRIRSRLTGGLAAAALIASAASPAAARDWRWGGKRHHHDHGPSAGAVIGTIAAVGLIAAIASAASKKDAEPRPEPRNSDRDWNDEDARYEDGGEDAPRYDDARPDRGAQDRAVDACVLAARSEASRNGDYAEIRGVTGVSARGNGGWDISGNVEQRSSYSATDGWQRSFRCSWQDGQVSAVSLN